ncbi:MAG TPA: pilus assembly protein PilM, partial [Candidatus Deferrimicrobium sp.]|nr:pilus assembly protein PilM [Candidatus Deferrimicrobium sp.]
KFTSGWQQRPARAAKETSAVSEVLLQPRRRLQLGRRLAFSVDDNSVQMAAVGHLGRRQKLIEIRKVYIPQGMSDATARRDFVARAVDDFLGRFSTGDAAVVITVSGKDTVFRSIVMPELKGRQLCSAVRFQAEKQIPFPLESCAYGYRPVYRLHGGEQRRCKVALYAATRRLIDEQLELFRARRIPVAAVYHTQEVIGRFLRHLPDFHPGAYSTLLEIDRHHTEIAFYRGSMLEFLHISAVGSSSLGAHAGPEGFERFAEIISAELQTALDYYAGQYPAGTADKVLVYGDLAYTDELLSSLNGHTGLAFERFPTDRLSFLSSDIGRFQEVLPVCLPVLAAAACDVRPINLLPDEDRRRRITQQVNRLAASLLVVSVLGLGTAWALKQHDVTTAGRNLWELNRQVESFKSSEAFHAYNVLKRQIAGQQVYLKNAKRLPSYLNLNLKELSLLTPSSVRLLHLDFDPTQGERNLSLQGTVTSREIPPEVLLAEYVEILSGSPFFEAVILKKHIKRPVGAAFEIEFQIDLRATV